MRPQRSAIQPPMGLKAMDTQEASDVIQATSAGVSCWSRVMGPRPTLSAELEKASRKRPPSASHQMVPARPEMPWRASMYEMTS